MSRLPAQPTTAAPAQSADLLVDGAAGVAQAPGAAPLDAAPDRRRVALVFAGCLTALALTALDQNVVATALPRIVGEFGDPSRLSWVTTGYMVASITTTPLCGRLSDVHGRRPVFIACIALFLVGSVLCGASRSMLELVLFRAVQGLGAGGLLTLAQTAVSDVVGPRERGRYQGLFSAVFAAASIAGPVVGGVITAVLSWRWIFYVNVPVGLLALALIAAALPRTGRVARPVDLAGAALLGVALSCTLLLVGGARSLFVPDSPAFLAVACGAVAGTAAFMLNERRAADPVVPLRLLASPVLASAFATLLLAAMGFFSAAVYLPLFLQTVLGHDPMAAGLMMSPMMGCVAVGSALSGRLVARRGRPQTFIAVGLALAAASLAGLAAAAGASRQDTLYEALLATLGSGLGISFPNITTLVQNRVPRADLGAATGLAAFCRSSGGLFGVALAGALVVAGAPAAGTAASLALHARVPDVTGLRAAFAAGSAAMAAAALLALAGTARRRGGTAPRPPGPVRSIDGTRMTVEIESLDVLVVGAGLSGVAAAYHLRRRLPRKRIAVLEARDALGGTWDLFRYPGVRSDSDMQTMGFSFRPWGGDVTLADGAAIANYIRDTARAFDLDRLIRLGHRVVRASWSSDEARWTVEVERAGGRVTLSCGFLIMCTGYYEYGAGHQPAWPGAEDFRGWLVHPQFWPRDLDTAGKRVVVVGSGATAVTLVPALAKGAAHVTLLQRSPTYVVSRPRRDPFATVMHRWLPARHADAAVRWKNIGQFIALFRFARWRPEAAARSIIASVREKLGSGYDTRNFTPRYKPWDQRICFAADGDLFGAIRAGRASVLTDTIDRLTPEGIRLGSGAALEADIIVSATGLEMRFVNGVRVEVDGNAVDWGRCVSYKNVMLSGVPNFALAIGYVNASWTLRCELTAIYVCRLLAHMDRRGMLNAGRIMGRGPARRPA